MHIDPDWQADQIILNRIAFGLSIAAVILLGFTADRIRRRQNRPPSLSRVLLCYALGFILYGAMAALMAAAIQQPHKPVLLIRSLQIAGTLIWIGATAILYRDLSRRSLEEQESHC